jgi:hypothetical protein
MSETIRRIFDEDPATAPQASYTPDVTELDTDLDVLREICALGDKDAAPRLAEWVKKYHPREDAFQLASEMFRVCLINILEARDPQREAWIWAVVAGMECAMGVSMEHLGRRFGVKKQAISKAVNDRLDRFGLRRNGYVHSSAYRDVHAQKMLTTAAWQERKTRVPQPYVKSIEAVQARFLGWANANQVSKGIHGWERERLERVLECLQPMVDLYHMAGQALAGRGDKHPPMRAEEILE